jgi:hypothetical protein
LGLAGAETNWRMSRRLYIKWFGVTAKADFKAVYCDMLTN